jgi:carboxyl-terminal processing protease
MPADFEVLWEAWQTLRDNAIYGDKLDAKVLSQGALRGMIDALDDPYAAYLDPETYRVEVEDRGGSFEGVGARVAVKDDMVIILSPLSDSPAEKAGLRPGDAILAVDGESTMGLNLYEVVMRVRGPAGTTVSLSILHEGDEQPVTIDVTRAKIDVPSVVLRGILEGNVAHVEIEEFNEDTDEEFGAMLARVQEGEAKGMILDLRYNPGGLLDTVVNITSYFLEDGLVLYEVDSDGERTNWSVRKVGKTTKVPVVVLVNEYSASGSEVLAGALRDRGRAILVGEKTFGKGSVNTMHPMSDGSAVYYTIARWYTPNGTLIEGQGLQPDFVVESEADTPGDPQLDVALEQMHKLLESK